MILVGLLRFDEEALLCDFAETYSIYNLEDFTPEYIAILAAGLRRDSRIKMKLAKIEYTIDELMLARAVDNLSILAWQNTLDGRNNRNRPKLLLQMLTGREEKSNLVTFDSPEAFEMAMKKYERG